MKNIEQFCTDYGIDINASKSQALIISSKNNVHKLDYNTLPKIRIGGDDIEYVQNVPDLGYQLNRTLTNDNHIKILQQKVMGALHTIAPLKIILSTEIKLKLYKSLILPIFDYMDIIYHNYGMHGTIGNDEKLERLQNICIRFILNINRREHITPHRNSLQLMTLYERRTLHLGSMINKILYKGAPAYLSEFLTVNTNNTRSNNKLIVNKPVNNFHKTSFHISGPTMWNKLPDEIRSIQNNKEFINSFKSYIENQNL